MKHVIAFLPIVLMISLALVFANACTKSSKPATAFDQTAHRNEIQKWQSNRLASLTKNDGWLTLVGLFWLNEGENKLGSDPKSAVLLPKDRAPGVAGSFWLEQGRVRLTARPEAKIYVAPPPGVEIK